MCVFFSPSPSWACPLTPPQRERWSFLGPGGLHFLAKLPEALVNGFHTQPVGDMQSLGSISHSKPWEWEGFTYLLAQKTYDKWLGTIANIRGPWSFWVKDNFCILSQLVFMLLLEEWPKNLQSSSEVKKKNMCFLMVANGIKSFWRCSHLHDLHHQKGLRVKPDRVVMWLLVFKMFPHCNFAKRRQCINLSGDPTSWWCRNPIKEYFTTGGCLVSVAESQTEVVLKETYIWHHCDLLHDGWGFYTHRTIGSMQLRYLPTVSHTKLLNNKSFPGKNYQLPAPIENHPLMEKNKHKSFLG